MQELIPLSRRRRIYHVEWTDDMINPNTPALQSRSAQRSSAVKHSTAMKPREKTQVNTQSKLKGNTRQNKAVRSAARHTDRSFDTTFLGGVIHWQDRQCHRGKERFQSTSSLSSPLFLVGLVCLVPHIMVIGRLRGSGHEG